MSEWTLKQGRHKHQAKHICPEPTHAWPTPGAFWFDVDIGSDEITCIDCDATIPVAIATLRPLDDRRCPTCKAYSRAPGCLRCRTCIEDALELGEELQLTGNEKRLN